MGRGTLKGWFSDVICGIRKHDWTHCLMDGTGTFISLCLFDFDQADINCLVELRSKAHWKARPCQARIQQCTHDPDPFDECVWEKAFIAWLSEGTLDRLNMRWHFLEWSSVLLKVKFHFVFWTLRGQWKFRSFWGVCGHAYTQSISIPSVDLHARI